MINNVVMTTEQSREFGEVQQTADHLPNVTIVMGRVEQITIQVDLT